MDLARHPVIEVSQPGRVPLRVVVTGTLELGRECDGLLLADERTSRRHAALVASPGGLSVMDLGSTNGTLVNGSPVTGPVPVGAGDTVVLGDTTVRVVSAPHQRVRPVTAATTGGVTTVGTAESEQIRRTVAEVVADERRADDAALDRLSQLDSTVTVVFSDIEDSTLWAERLGDTDWMARLGSHDRLVRDAVRRHNGMVIKHQGDGFMLAFSSARRAALCAVAVQRAMSDAPGDPPLRVRIGLHTGEAIVEGGDLFGRHVIVAARVSGLASGGQILATSVVAELVAGDPRIRFGPGTPVSLKGLTGQQVVHEVLWEPTDA